MTVLANLYQFPNKDARSLKLLLSASVTKNRDVSASFFRDFSARKKQKHRRRKKATEAVVGDRDSVRN